MEPTEGPIQESGPDPAPQKNKTPRLLGFGALLGFVWFAANRGFAAVNASPSWIVGLGWFTAVTIALIAFIWLWDHTNRRHIAVRILLSLVAMCVVAASTYGPVLNQYRKEHPAPPAPKQVETPASPPTTAPVIAKADPPTPKKPPSPQTIPTPRTTAPPSTPSEKARPTLLGLFKTDFSGIGGLTDGGFDLKDSAGNLIHIDRRVLADFAGKNKFLAFYISSSEQLPDVCMALADIASTMALLGFPSGVNLIGGDSASGMTSLKDLTFSGRVFIYHEWPLTNKEKADLIEAYSSKNLDVQFRGIDYLSPRLNEWYKNRSSK
jgi:hypothetical protein